MSAFRRDLHASRVALSKECGGALTATIFYDSMLGCLESVVEFGKTILRYSQLNAPAGQQQTWDCSAACLHMGNAAEIVPRELRECSTPTVEVLVSCA